MQSWPSIDVSAMTSLDFQLHYSTQMIRTNQAEHFSQCTEYVCPIRFNQTTEFRQNGGPKRTNHSLSSLSRSRATHKSSFYLSSDGKTTLWEAGTLDQPNHRSVLASGLFAAAVVWRKAYFVGKYIVVHHLIPDMLLNIFSDNPLGWWADTVARYLPMQALTTHP